MDGFALPFIWPTHVAQKATFPRLEKTDRHID
jgi:hypothetical protein